MPSRFVVAIALMPFAAGAALAQEPIHIELVMSAAPSIDTAAAASGMYLPSEAVPIGVSLRSTGVAQGNIGLVQISYLASGANGAVIDWNSDSLAPGFPLPLLINAQNSPLFAAVTQAIPSPFTIPAAPDSVPFMTFTAFAPITADQTHFVNLLGICSPDDSVYQAYVATSTFDQIWDNCDFDPARNVVGGVIGLTTIPEPRALTVLVFLSGAVWLRVGGRACARQRNRACPPGGTLVLRRA